MGEWSKSVGEKGEKIVDFFFKEILGYDTLLLNESIACNKGQKHKEAGKDKTTHGIDALVSARSPLEDNILDINIISSKFTSKEYPISNTTIKTTFKKHIKELAYTIECFKNSKLYSTINQQYKNVDKTLINGILVWTSNKSSEDFEIISKVANSMLEDDLIFDRIILIDNNRINFFVETVQSVKKEYGTGNAKFVYHNTGVNNNNLQTNSYGDFLPFEYIFSDIIPMRIDNKGEIELIILSKNNFSEDNFLMTLAFAKTFDHLDSTTKTIISFPDFNDLEHKSVVNSTLMNFKHYNINKNLSIKKHSEDFKNY